MTEKSRKIYVVQRLLCLKICRYCQSQDFLQSPCLDDYENAI